MKKPKIFFRTIGTSGPLAIYWYPGPYGDVIESESGNGVFWQTQNGLLLGVEFDDVNKNYDHQILRLPFGSAIEITVNDGRVTINNILKKQKIPLKRTQAKEKAK